MFFPALILCLQCRYGVKENTLGVGLNQLAVEGSHQASFLAIFEEKFTADVSFFLACYLLYPITLSPIFADETHVSLRIVV